MQRLHGYRHRLRSLGRRGVSLTTGQQHGEHTGCYNKSFPSHQALS
ncbi:hypothetical protein D083_0979 [Dickeya solani RNS 08.23.3.1.A]|nr:hypothetical protein D083_0979 [Dickeya solani RNS 08.23.3.1.A]